MDFIQSIVAWIQGLVKKFQDFIAAIRDKNDNGWKEEEDVTTPVA